MLETINSLIKGWIVKLFFLPKGIKISYNTKIIINQKAKISLLKKSRIFFNCYLLLQKNSEFIAKKNFYLGQGAEVVLTNNSILDIGENVYIGSYSNIRCSGKIKIGNNVRIAQHVSIIDSNYEISNSEIKGISPDQIIIEDNVWIGAGAIILPGVIVKEGSIIGAGSIVNKNVDERTLFAGNPARMIKNI